MGLSVKETMEAMRKAHQAGADQSIDPLAKAFTQATGLVAFNLEAPAKTLYPVLTPLRNKIPRNGGGKGTAVNWKAVTGINVNNLEGGVSEGNRGGTLTTGVQSLLASYKGLGFEDNVTFEADYAARSFDDAKARAVVGLLRSTMIYEEKVLLGGNATLALGTTPTPSLTTATTGGAIGATITVSVICVALTMEGFFSASLASGVRGAVARTNADATVDNYGGGSAQKSAAATIATGAGSTNIVSASVALVKGAYAYAWYANTAGAERLAAITTINSVVITTLPGASQLASALPASDNSQNALVFDGIIPQTVGSGALTSYLVGQGGMTLFTGSTGGIVGQMATGTPGTGTPLTADGKGGVVEIDAMLRAFWDISRLSPECIWVNSQEANNITTKVLTATSSGASRLIATDQAGVKGGFMVRSYLNKFTMDGAAEIPIKIHPNLTPGTIFFETENLPYQMSNVPSVLELDIRQEYYQLEWPRRTRKYEYGVYVDEVLKHYFPSAFGVLTNIANG